MVDLALSVRREAAVQRKAYIRDFLALTGLFGTLYAWFVLGTALVA